MPYIYTGTGSKTSALWKHFKELRRDDDSPARAKCLNCSSSFYVSHGNMRRHLRLKHPDVFNALQRSEGREIKERPIEAVDALEFSDNEAETASPTNGKHSKQTNEYLTPSRIKYEQIEYLDLTRPKRKFKKTEPRREKVTSTSNYPCQVDEDKFDVFSKLVAIKMRGLNNSQRIVAEKIINDTLHEAQLGSLNKYCGLTLVQTEPLQTTDPQQVQIKMLGSLGNESSDMPVV